MGRKPKSQVSYKVKEKSYVHIQAFMVNDLHLSGNELIIYAIIYGFSQDGQSWFEGSRKYLSAWCQVTDETVTYNLNKLIEKGFVECREKRVHDVTFKDYRAVLDILGVAEKTVPPSEKTVPETEKPLPHILEDTLVTDARKERKKPTETFDSIIAGRTDNQELKEALGEFIRMRARIKKPLTNYALRLRLNRLWKLADTDELRIAIVNQSIGACWQDFFPLKDDAPKTDRRSQYTEQQNQEFDEYAWDPDQIERG